MVAPRQWAGLRRGRPTCARRRIERRLRTHRRTGRSGAGKHAQPHASRRHPRRPRCRARTATWRARYDVVVVGSGYGGAIAASRLARAGRSVCVLERGREFAAGRLPRRCRRRGRASCRSGGAPAGSGAATGLFDLRAGDDLSVLVGLRPRRDVADQRRRGAAAARLGVRRALARRRSAARPGRDELDPYFERAEVMLGATPFPDDWPVPAKLAVLQPGRRARRATPVTRPPINVTFADGPNAAGVEQRACTLCGDCVSGCNHRAKNTVTENYLPDAVAHGAQIFCETSVRTVERAPDGAEAAWVVTFDVHRRRARPLRRARLVRVRRRRRARGRHARLHRDPASLPRAWPGRLPPAGRALHGQRRRPRVRLRRAGQPDAGHRRRSAGGHPGDRRRPVHHGRHRPHRHAGARQGRAHRGGRHPRRPADPHARGVRRGGRRRRRRQPAVVRPAAWPAGSRPPPARRSTPPVARPTARSPTWS